MTDHTPGPWKVSPGSDRDGRGHEYNWDVTALNGARYIAEVYATAADARLIAAAPDLLAALEAIASGKHGGHASSFAREVLDRATIAKVKGDADA